MAKAYAFVLVVLSSLAARSASATEMDFGEWSGLVLQGKLTDSFGWYFENQVRLHVGQPAKETVDPLLWRNNRILVRPALRYLPLGDGRLQLFLGYAYTPNFSPHRDEHRIWEQVLTQSDGESLWVAGRLRLEQRFISDTESMAWRARLFGRFTPYLTASRQFGLAIWDELFWNLNSVENGPKGGFDQNRAFVGLNVRAGTSTRLELGYMNLFGAKGRGADSVDSHVASLFAYVDL